MQVHIFPCVYVWQLHTNVHTLVVVLISRVKGEDPTFTSVWVEPAGVEQKKKKKKKEKLRATPLEMSFTAALPQKSHVSLKWRALQRKRYKPETNPQPTHNCTSAHLTKWVSQFWFCLCSTRSPSLLPLFSLKVKRAERSRAPQWADLLTHPTEEDMSRWEDRQLGVLLRTMLTSEEHQYSCCSPLRSQQWMDGPEKVSNCSPLSTSALTLHRPWSSLSAALDVSELTEQVKSHLKKWPKTDDFTFVSNVLLLRSASGCSSGTSFRACLSAAGVCIGAFVRALKSYPEDYDDVRGWCKEQGGGRERVGVVEEGLLESHVLWDYSSREGWLGQMKVRLGDLRLRKLWAIAQTGRNAQWVEKNK